jgi:periplasmic protein TonB
MQYVMRDQSFGKNVTRIGLVVGAHVLFGAALVTTLNRVPIFSEPTVTTLVPVAPVTPVEKTPEPPRPIKNMHKPVFQQPTVPLPEFPIDRPAVVDVITATPSNAVTPSESRDPSPPTVVDSGTVSPSSSHLGVACPNAVQVQSNMRYPVQAARDGIEGDVTARFVVTAAGEIKNIAIVASSNRVFNSVVTQAVQQFGCRGQGQDVTVEAPFTFRLK